MEQVLEKVKSFVDQAHGEQMRKYTPDRYIVHPVRVMELCRQYTDDISVLAAALLHDVLEDTPVKEEEIRTFLSGLMNERQTAKTVKLVKELTDEFIKTNYPHLNRRARKAQEVERLSKTSADAQTIKYADIIDNAREIVSHDASFAKVFVRECDALLRNMKKGNPELYARAQETLQKALQEMSKGNQAL
jgi:guanosine-3',5'-bis(diphosphate) 3'-pyrophosphohydrolase